MRLLIVEDDTELSSVLVRGFREEGFAVDPSYDGEDGLHAAMNDEYDLIILDLMLPGCDGFEVLRRLREGGCGTPVLFLTARHEIADRIRGLQLGGDDYLPKPFSFEELLARARAVLRRTKGLAQSHLQWGQLHLDMDTHRVSWGNTELSLTPKEFQLLEALLLHRGKVLSRTRLVMHVYDELFECDSNVVDAHVANLRRKLRRATGTNVVETVRGVGFLIPSEPA